MRSVRQASQPRGSGRVRGSTSVKGSAIDPSTRKWVAAERRFWKGQIGNSLPDFCKGEWGKVAPVVDSEPMRSEGRLRSRLSLRPIFEIRPLAASDRASLSFIGKIKAWAHAGKQAYVIRPQACHACRLCIEACPEDALRLAPIRNQEQVVCAHPLDPGRW